MLKLSCLDKTERQAPPYPLRIKITQTMLYRQSLILYADKHGVTKAAIRYNTNRHYILPLAQALRWDAAISGRPLTPSVPSPKSTPAGRDQAHR